MKSISDGLQIILPPLRSRKAIIPLAALLLLSALPAPADQYHGNGDPGFGGAIGNGTLTLSDDGTNISGTLTVGGSMNDVLVLYIQTGPGGFADTSGFNDQSDLCPQAISGVSASGRSLLTFASGFQANYAIALAPAAVGTGGLWQLASGTNNSLVYMGSVSLAPLNNTGPYTFSFPAALIGMIPGVRSTIQVFGTYVRTDGFRSTETIAGDVTGAQGWNPFTQTACANYTFDAGAVLVNLPLGSWAQRASGNAPTGRCYCTTIWTGSEMIVWGGGNGTLSYLDDGGRYNPAANAWTAVPNTLPNTPSGRQEHTAVWTGSEMIIWGGVANGALPERRGALRPGCQQLDRPDHHRRPRRAHGPHGGVDGQRDDRLGRSGAGHLIRRRRALQSDRRHVGPPCPPPAPPAGAVTTRRCGRAAR